MMVTKHLPGEKYGRWTLVKNIGNGSWTCRCDCGARCVRYLSSITLGSSQSCGCLRDELREASKKKNKGKVRDVWYCKKNKGMTINRGEVAGTMFLAPQIEMTKVTADDNTACAFCHRSGFSRKDINHFELSSGESVVHLCYGCALSVGDLLWKNFKLPEYNKIINPNVPTKI